MINVGVQLAGSSGSPKWPEIIFFGLKRSKNDVPATANEKQN